MLRKYFTSSLLLVTLISFELFLVGASLALYIYITKLCIDFSFLSYFAFSTSHLFVVVHRRKLSFPTPLLAFKKTHAPHYGRYVTNVRIACLSDLT